MFKFTQLGKVLTYNKNLALKKSHDPSITCFSRSRDKLSTLYLNQYWVNGLQTWQGGDLQ